MSVLATLFVYFLVPETKGRTLEEMDELFGSVGFAAQDKDLRAKIESDVGLLLLLGGEEDHFANAEKRSMSGIQKETI